MHMGCYNVRLFEYEKSYQIRLYKRYIENKKGTLKELYPPKKDPKAGRSKKDPKIKPDLRIRTAREIEHSLVVAQNRAKQNIYQITRANRWDWYVTLTLDPEKIDRTNYDACVAAVRKWFNNVKQRIAPGLRYIIIPELHKDGKSYHFHGLLADCDGLVFTDSKVRQKGKKVYNLAQYNLGFTNCTKVTDTRKVSAYITKYITKELQAHIKGKRRYLASNNCKRGDVTEYNVRPEEKQELLAYCSLCEEIGHMKSQSLIEAGQCISYIELIADDSNDTLKFLLKSFGARSAPFSKVKRKPEMEGLERPEHTISGGSVFRSAHRSD